MTKLVNRAKVKTTTTGTGTTIMLGSTIPGYQSFASAGVLNSDVVRYAIEQDAEWEIGTGTYSSAGNTLTRTVTESSNAGAPINLTGNADVYVTAAADDLLQPQDIGVTVQGYTAALQGTTASYTTALNSKLSGIEAGATADQTAAEILTAIKTVDGTGTGLDADLLDGQHGAYYTGYTDTAIANLVATAPATLDTLNELATALGNDPNFATTVTTSIGTKAASAITISAGAGMTGGGDLTANRTISHADTSTQASLTALTGANVISDVDVDTYGHVTAMATRTMTAADLGAITGNQTITLSGDVSGSGTTSIVVTVADDSHNHIIGNVDGLQTALDGKASTSHNHTLDSLSNTTITANTSGEILKWNGSAWVNNTLSEAGIQPSGSYLTGNQTITLSGDLTGSGTTAINAQLAANVVGANELNVTGNGTTAQYLRSDGDGTFTWATPTDTNTTYSAGTGLSLVGTTFSNASPDQTVTLTQGGATTITGTYPNFTISSTDTNTTYSVGNGGLTEVNFTYALTNKLAGIEDGATADQTAAEILTAIKTVDGHTSGLDADLLDGIHGNNYVQGSNSNRTTSGANLNNAQPSGFYDVYNGNGTPTSTWYTFINARHNNESNNYGSQIACSFYDTADFYVRRIENDNYSSWAKIWNSSNDGSGSGLDADLLDGQQGSYYQPASTAITTANIGSQSVSSAVDATYANYAETAYRAYPKRVGDIDLNFNWSGQSGQPPWLWGGSDGSNMYVYNPSNFSVAYAASAGSVSPPAANTVGSTAFLTQAANYTWSLVPGVNYSGSILRYAGVYGEIQSYGVLTWYNAAPSGTWQCTGGSELGTAGVKRSTTFIRVA